MGLSSGVLYHRLAYEQLIGPWREYYLGLAMHFVGGSSVATFPASKGTMQPIHAQTCGARLANFEQLRRLIDGTRSALACDMLDDFDAMHVGKPSIPRLVHT